MRRIERSAPFEALRMWRRDDVVSTLERERAEAARKAETQQRSSWFSWRRSSKTEDAFEDDGSDALSWPWQTCAEFGFYQTCEVGSQCPFARGYVSVADEISICAQFGLTPSVVADNVAFSNQVYGGASPMGSRILFPNGDVDPWTGLGVLESPAPTEPVMIVVGASHHAWTHPADTITQQTGRNAKKAIQSQVKQWLAVA